MSRIKRVVAYVRRFFNVDVPEGHLAYNSIAYGAPWGRVAYTVVTTSARTRRDDRLR